MTIADVRRWRKMAGISREKAAELVNYNYDHYNCIERETRPMPEGFDQRFARKLIRHCQHVVKILHVEAES